MKKYVAIFVSMLALMFVSTSCQPESFDQYDLVGVWENDDNAGEFWRYRSDLTGCTWDEGDDVTEEEAQEFTWTLVVNTLTQIHIIEISNTQIPKVYTVTELTSSSLVYEDDFGKSYYFSRVE